MFPLLNSEKASFKILIYSFVGLIITVFVLTISYSSYYMFFDKKEHEIIDSNLFEVESVDFKGESDLWSDKRIVSFQTMNDGVWVYPLEHVEFKERTNINGLSIEVINYSDDSSRVILNVGDDKVVETRSDYANFFNENIKFSN